MNPQPPIDTVQPHSPEKQALLQQMSDIIAPDPVGFWPLAPGWWILVFILLAAFGISFFYLKNYIQEKRYRRQALVLLDELQSSSNEKPANTLNELLFRLLKRTLLTAYPHSRDRLANLHGKALFNVLSVTCENNPVTIEQSWFTAAYQKDSTVDFDALFNYSRYWIKNHKRLNKFTLGQRLQKTSETTEAHKTVTTQEGLKRA